MLRHQHRQQYQRQQGLLRGCELSGTRTFQLPVEAAQVHPAVLRLAGLQQQMAAWVGVLCAPMTSLSYQVRYESHGMNAVCLVECGTVLDVIHLQVIYGYWTNLVCSGKVHFIGLSVWLYPQAQQRLQSGGIRRRRHL